MFYISLLFVQNIVPSEMQHQPCPISLNTQHILYLLTKEIPIRFLTNIVKLLSSISRFFFCFYLIYCILIDKYPSRWCNPEWFNAWILFLLTDQPQCSEARLSGDNCCHARSCGRSLFFSDTLPIFPQWWENKHQRLNVGSRSMTNWVNFIWGSGFVHSFFPGLKPWTPEQMCLEGWVGGCGLGPELVLGLNSEFRGRLKVRVMARLGSWWGQSMQTPEDRE